MRQIVFNKDSKASRMKKLITLILVLVAVCGVSADLVELSYTTSVVYSSINEYQKYDTVTYIFRYDTDQSGQIEFSNGTVMGLDELVDDNGLHHKCFYAEIVSSAFKDDQNVSLATMGDQYNIGLNITGEDNSIVDAFFYLGSDYHTINIFTESHDTVGTDNGINSWANDATLNLKIIETIARSENDTDIIITHFPVRVKPLPPLPPPPPPQNVPEPSVAASLCLGILVLSGTAVRRYLRKKR
jgi:hypothetical protein